MVTLHYAEMNELSIPYEERFTVKILYTYFRITLIFSEVPKSIFVLVLLVCMIWKILWLDNNQLFLFFKIRYTRS